MAPIFFGDAEIVRDTDDGEMLVAIQLSQVLHEPRFYDEIHTPCRFVQDEQTRAAGESAGDQDALSLTAGERPIIAMFHAGEIYLRQGPGYALGFLGASIPNTAESQTDELAHCRGQARIKVAALRHEADPIRARSRRIAPNLAFDARQKI